jgi:polysaccharide chain length determinant protein (PEP-CTERM system associated)
MANALSMSVPQSPAEYLEILRFRWPWVLAAIVLGALGSQVALRFAPKQYMSQTVVLVESEKIPKSFIPRITTEDSKDVFRSLADEILARPRVERILDELNPYPEMIDAPRADVVDLVRARTAIGIRGKDAFVIQYTDTDPERAQRMATRLASMFIEETSGDRARQVQGANEFIDSQLIETKQQLEQVESSLRKIKQRYMGMLPNQLEANLSTLQRLELERQSVAEQIRVAKERKDLFERQIALQSQMGEPEAQLVPDAPSSGAPAPGPQSPDSLAGLKAYLDQLLTRYTAEHPEVMATQKRIARLESELQARQAVEAILAPVELGADDIAPTMIASNDNVVSELPAQLAALDRDIQTLEARHEQLRADIGNYQGRVEKIPEVEQELESLERDYDLIGKYYSELLSRKLEAETAGAVERRWQEEQFKILDPAQIPEKPESPKPPIFLMFGTLIGLGAGLALAILLEVADPTVKNIREMEALLPYPVLLTLPRLKEPKRRFQRRKARPIPPSPPSTKDDEAELQAAS